MRTTSERLVGFPAALAGLAALALLAATARAADAPSDVKHPGVMGGVSNGQAGGAAEAALARGWARSDLIAQQLGRLAESRAGNAAVVAYGRWVAGDAAEDLRALRAAMGPGASLPDAPDPARRAVIAHLSTLRGRAFDDAYLSATAKDQRDAAKALQREAGTGVTDALTFYAARQLPILQAHVEEADNLRTRAPGAEKGPPDSGIDTDAQREFERQEADRMRHDR